MVNVENELTNAFMTRLQQHGIIKNLNDFDKYFDLPIPIHIHSVSGSYMHSKLEKNIYLKGYHNFQQSQIILFVPKSGFPVYRNSSELQQNIYNIFCYLKINLMTQFQHK